MIVEVPLALSNALRQAGSVTVKSAWNGIAIQTFLRSW